MNAAQDINIWNVSVDNHIFQKRIIIGSYPWLLVATYRYISKKKYWLGQERGVSKRAVSLMHLITNLRIWWLKLLEVADWEPYNEKLTFSLTFKFKKLESTFSRFSKSFNLCRE